MESAFDSLADDISYMRELSSPPLFEKILNLKLRSKFSYHSTFIKSRLLTKSGVGVKFSQRTYVHLRSISSASFDFLF
jgi:hypothetical protein